MIHCSCTMPYFLFPAIFQDRLHTTVQIFFDVTFPEMKHQPAKVREGCIVILVSFHVTAEFFRPEFLVVLDLLSGVVLMTSCVPKVPVDKNGNPISCDGNIRGSREFSVILAIADSMGPKGLAQHSFRRRVFSADPAHDF